MGFRVYLRHGTSVCWHIKSRHEHGLVAADLRSTVVHSSKLLTTILYPFTHLLTYFEQFVFNYPLPLIC